MTVCRYKEKIVFHAGVEEIKSTTDNKLEWEIILIRVIKIADEKRCE